MHRATSVNSEECILMQDLLTPECEPFLFTTSSGACINRMAPNTFGAATAKLDPWAEQHHMPQHPLPIGWHHTTRQPSSQDPSVSDSATRMNLVSTGGTGGGFAVHTPFMALCPAHGK